jgi:branched-chain amino acid transport system substrate-binding protein
VKKLGWNVDLLGEVASYDTAIAEAPGNVAEGFFSMAPSLYAYPDDPRPAGKAFMQKYKVKYGVESKLPRPDGVHLGADSHPGAAPAGRTDGAISGNRTAWCARL